MKGLTLTTKVIERALEYLNSAEVFAKTQVPAVLEEILKYETALSIGFVILSLILVFVGICMMYKGQFIKDRYGNLADTGGVLIFLGTVNLLIGVILGIARSLVLINIYFAPKLFLIKYFSNLV